LIIDLIPGLETIKTDLAADILQYYLHHPNLKVPIEPFHSILVSKLHQKTKTLWNMNMLNPDMFFYGSRKGLAEDSENLDTGNYSYLVDIQSRKFILRDSVSQLDQYISSLPDSRPECLACPHFHICIGWALYQKDTCSKWKNLLTELQKASREILALEKFDQEHAIVSPQDKKSDSE
jgi:hypothetical protein